MSSCRKAIPTELLLKLAFPLKMIKKLTNISDGDGCVCTYTHCDIIDEIITIRYTKEMINHSLLLISMCTHA